jgi:hypothetical protein
MKTRGLRIKGMMENRRPYRTVAACFTTVVLLTTAMAAAAYAPQPMGLTREAAIGGKTYLQVSGLPVMIDLVGPGTLSGFARCTYAPGENVARTGRLRVEGFPQGEVDLPLTFTPSTTTVFDDARPLIPSGGARFELAVPEGAWTLILRGEVDAPSPGAEDVFALFAYDGPPQARAGAAAAAAPAKKTSPWTFANTFGLQFIYDDNILTQSEDAIDIFLAGTDPEAYRIRSYDDLLIVPSLDLEARRTFLSLGESRFRVRVKHWRYMWNPNKTNTDFDLLLRQYFGKRTSLEFFAQHAPEQYIRELGDSTPFTDEAYRQKDFRFTRNVVNLSLRHQFNRKYAGRFTVETNRRYYNQQFIENDIEALELRGNLNIRPSRWLTVDLDYGYEMADGRGRDTSLETRENSDDGDPSYNRDLYRVGLGLSTPQLAPVVDGISLAYLFMDYYYTTEKNIFEAPFQVARRDKWSKAFVTLSKQLNRDVALDAGFVYSWRKVESPWYGDITLDKDYDQHRYSLGLSYRF